jgi:hypothetical protein
MALGKATLEVVVLGGSHQVSVMVVNLVLGMAISSLRLWVDEVISVMRSSRRLGHERLRRFGIHGIVAAGHLGSLAACTVLRATR